MLARLKREIKEFGLLMRSAPPITLAIFIVSVCAMNLLANKSIDIPLDWLALDCGIIVSWFAFISMDVLTKHFGPKAATEISVVAVLFNLVLCLLFFLGSLIPGQWGESFGSASAGEINAALDRTFGGTWYVLLGSTVAFLASAVINNFVNFAVGKCFKKKPDGAAAFFMRSYVSTAIAQFVDNLVFAFIVSYFFFGWSPLQCITCAATGMVVELLFEVVFSPLGYKICNKWRRDSVGAAYLELISARKVGTAGENPSGNTQNVDRSSEITEETSV
ncbi:MAG: VUT family protein [Clostridiales bacterium]|nr:VUT family protein [Clostridiales bacterium]